MPEITSPIDITEIAEILEDRKSNSQRIAVILGSRSGALFLSAGFYDELKAYSFRNFADMDQRTQFHECYAILDDICKRRSMSIKELKSFIEGQIYGHADVENHVAALVKDDFFKVIITNNIDDILYESFKAVDMRENEDFVDFSLGRHSCADDIERILSQKKINIRPLIRMAGDIDTFIDNFNRPQAKESAGECVRILLDRLRIRELLIIGIDLAWDQPILSALPSHLETIWFINEDEHVKDKFIEQCAGTKNFRYLIGPKGHYKQFFKHLYWKTQADFPREIRDKTPTFPSGGLTPSNHSDLISGTNTSYSSSPISVSLIEQIHSAFDKKDWLHVVRKVDYLSKIAPEALSPEIYRMQGRAFSEDGNKQRASEALQNSLALSTDDTQRLILLEDHSAILIALNKWSEVLDCAREALRLAPSNTTWLELQQHSITQLQNNQKGNSSESSPKTSSIPPSSPSKSLEIFFSYSHKDKKILSELKKYLRNLKSQSKIIYWHDGEISAGNVWAEEIKKHLSQANIILLLISQDFLASEYCHSVEMQQALERHRRDEVCIVPIILRPVDWENTPFRELQALPTGLKPIIKWSLRDEAYLDVARGIQKVIVDRLTGNVSLGG